MIIDLTNDVDTFPIKPEISRQTKYAAKTEINEEKKIDISTDWEQFPEFPWNDFGNVLKNSPLNFQSKGISWMLLREKYDGLPPNWTERGHIYYNDLLAHKSDQRPPCIRGGILGDDMGLGKSFQIICCILAHRKPGHLITPGEHAEEVEFVKERLQTLTSMNKKELDAAKHKFDREYNPVIDLTALRDDDYDEEGDVFMSTKDRKQVKRERAKREKAAAKTLQSPELAALGSSRHEWTHVMAHCEGTRAFSRVNSESIVSSAASTNETKTTLIICPLTCVGVWREQFDLHVVADTLRIYEFHGTKRIMDPAFLREQDVIITSFHTLASEMKRKRAASKSQPARGILALSYWRVVLDEAHIIRNKDTKTYQACMDIDSHVRWCLTGTPLLNYPMDVFPYFSFLRYAPLRDWEKFEELIDRWLKSTVRETYSRGLERLRQNQAAITLRREKSVLKMPILRIIQVLKLKMTEAQREVYHIIYDSFRELLRVLLRHKRFAKEVWKRMACILACITHLRLCCDSHLLVPQWRIDTGRHILSEIKRLRGDGLEIDGVVEVRDITPKEALELLKLLENKGRKKANGSKRARREEAKEEEDEEDEVGIDTSDAENDDDDDDDEDACLTCSICDDFIETDDQIFVATPCGCSFCEECIYGNVPNPDVKSCPHCNMRLKIEICSKVELQAEAESRMLREDVDPIIFKKIQDAKKAEHKKRLAVTDWSVSAGPCNVPEKVKHLIKILHEMRAEDVTHKAVIFSQFTSYLYIVGLCMKAAGFSFGMIEGSTTLAERRLNVDLWKMENPPYVPAEENANAASKNPTSKLPSTKVDGFPFLLVSTKAGGFSLTLTAGSYVHMLDPLWNFPSELQAYDRCYRMGQKKNVYVTRYTMDPSIEAPILQLQESKKMTAKGSLRPLTDDEVNISMSRKVQLFFDLNDRV